MIKSLLIANRGEIACRIIKTARLMGIRTVAVYSDADQHAMHVREADEAFRLGPASVAESYLRTGRILKIARDAGVDAIHPGYGFLSENADFAELCAEAGMIFIGPPPTAIRAMGLKDQAKIIMKEAGVPVVPGYHGDKQDAEFLKRKAYETGYPVLIKAVAGGGGKGMRRVAKAIEFDKALEAARREALSAFGNEKMLIEKFVSAPRHIEFQIFADSHGNVVHLFERDCSLQRRHQKVIEEAPAPGMTEAVRAVMGEAACNAARAVGYQGAGTVEFIVDGEGGLSTSGFYFMEMNTRLQVEHPVSEMITGVDLVEWQIRVAAGEKLPLLQNELQISGHAVEARVYAEDPSAGFLPSTGKLHHVEFPGSVRTDTGVETGDNISPYYDPMMAKLISHADTRDQALDKLKDALNNSKIAGPKTNLAFLSALCSNNKFRSGEFDTGLIDDNLDQLTGRQNVDKGLEVAGIRALIGKEQARIANRQDGNSPWSINDAYSNGVPREQIFDYIINGEAKNCRVRHSKNGLCVLDIDGNAIEPASGHSIVETARHVFVLKNGQQLILEPFIASSRLESAGGGDGVVAVPMHGKIVSVSVSNGDVVEQGDLLFAIEAMKMEHAVLAPIAGTVSECVVKTGEQMPDSAIALRIEAIS